MNITLFLPYNSSGLVFRSREETKLKTRRIPWTLLLSLLLLPVSSPVVPLSFDRLSKDPDGFNLHRTDSRHLPGYVDSSILVSQARKEYSFKKNGKGANLDREDVQKIPPPSNPPQNTTGNSRLESPTTLTPNPRTTMSYGKRHPNWSEKDARNFLNIIDAVMKHGGKYLIQREWKGTWHRGSRSFSALNGDRIEYRTKSEFNHHSKTDGRDDTMEIYFWRYQHPNHATQSLKAIVEMQEKHIHKNSNKLVAFEYAGRNKLALGDESFYTDIKSTSLLNKKRSQIHRNYYMTISNWAIVVAHSSSKYEAGRTALSALDYGFSQVGLKSGRKGSPYPSASIKDRLPDIDRAKPPKESEPF